MIFFLVWNAKFLFYFFSFFFGDWTIKNNNYTTNGSYFLMLGGECLKRAKGGRTMKKKNKNK
jgi:hypothetical protein